MLLTRAPLYSWYCYHFLVRLACVRHAASVDSEPGSNSRLKPDVFPLRRRSNWVDRPAHLLAKDAGTLLVRMIEPNPITSHDWHVQPICQRSLRVVRLSGSLLDRGPDSRPAVLELDAHRPISPLSQRTSAFLREPFEVIKVWVQGQGNNPPEPLWITRPHCARIKERPAKIARVRPWRTRGR